jgi:hypothetical protein
MTKQTTQLPGFGAQTHGSRKRLGGDQANCAVVPRRIASQAKDKATQAQISDMESEGQGQQNRTP